MATHVSTLLGQTKASPNYSRLGVRSKFVYGDDFV
jgi:hypothetical protein